MLRYYPTKAQVQESGLTWLSKKQSHRISNFTLSNDRFCVPDRNLDIDINKIEKIDLIESSESERVPHNGEFSLGGVPFVYGSFTIRETILTMQIEGVPHKTIFTAYHNPSCEYQGAHWPIRLPDAAIRLQEKEYLRSIYAKLASDIRKRHIEKACNILENGGIVTDCGSSVTFTQSGVNVEYLRTRFLDYMRGKITRFSCKYSDVIVDHVGDPYFPDKVTVSFRGVTDADAQRVFTNNLGEYCPYLIRPIVEMMTAKEAGRYVAARSSQKTPQERLKTISNLLESKAITEEEYNEKRRAILDDL